MAHGRPGISRGATPSTRAVALAACVVAMGLLAWRGTEILTRAPASPGPLSQTEASLLAVTEAVAGQGHVRVSVARQVGGGQQILVLLDEKSVIDDAVLENVVRLASGSGDGDRDRVVIQRAPFAAGVTGAPAPSDWAELSLLAFLAGLSGWLSLSAGRREDAPVEVVREILPARMAPVPSEPVRPAAPSHAGEAADLARRDPSRAADVVRGWMGSGGNA